MYTIFCCSIEFCFVFDQREYTIYEGKSITLIVIENQGFTGGIARGGMPEDHLPESFLLFFDIDSTADES